jgi:hypothetical protein
MLTGMSYDDVAAMIDWGDIQGVAIVHVQGDHFMLYDAENGLFYDPAEMEGPGVASDRVPTSYLTVYPSALTVAKLS